MEMTISGLREKLGEANDEQLRELICQLYKQSEVAQQIVDSRFLGDGYGLRIAKEANQKLEQAFFHIEKLIVLYPRQRSCCESFVRAVKTNGH